MRPLPARMIIKILLSHGFILSRQRGSHAIFKNFEGVMIPVPLHGKNRPIPIGTFLAIVKQSKIPPEEFKK